MQRLIKTEHSAAFLPEGSALRRLPRDSKRARPDGFFQRYEDRALAYDCFWHADGARILVVGPPPMNLMPTVRAARYEALPSRAVLTPSYHPSLSTMVTSLAGAPRDTAEIVMHVGGEDYRLRVQPNHSADLAGRRVLFTMSKDNDLAWVEEWARWHAAMHKADAIVFFDNGSARYGIGELQATLSGVAGIDKLVIESWPYRYGMTDTAFIVNPFYILFLQVSSMSVVLRRYGAAAYGILNCDIDELATAPEGTSVFDLAKQSRHGLLAMRGRYIEAMAEDGAPAAGRTHRHFQRYLADLKKADGGPTKWVLDPTRKWVENLSVQPYMHWIQGRPLFGKAMLESAYYRHFRGINTNWKDNRTEAIGLRTDELVHDAEFAGLVARNAY